MSSIGGSDANRDLVLVEPERITRDALAALIERESAFRVVGRFEQLRELASLPAEPRVLLTALDLPDGRGPAAIQAALRYVSSASILVLTGVSHPSIVQQVLDAGATGYILTSATPEELVRAIETVARKEAYLHPSVSAELDRWHSSDAVPTTALRHLSHKETDVLRWLALGHTNAEIATLSGVSLRTVETHRARIFHKLGLRTRAELVRYAFDEGLIAER